MHVLCTKIIIPFTPQEFFVRNNNTIYSSVHHMAIQVVAYNHYFVNSNLEVEFTTSLFSSANLVNMPSYQASYSVTQYACKS